MRGLAEFRVDEQMAEDADPPLADSAAAALGRAMPITSLVDCGMDGADAMELRARCASGEDWADVAAALAGARASRARRALAEGHPITAIIQARWAAGAAWCAQLADHRDTARKRSLYQNFTESLAFIASLDGMRRVEAPYRGGRLNGWLRQPAAQPAAGTVIVWGGLSNWAPAHLRTADAITARGLACLLAEGPGQGEPRLEYSLYMDELAADGFARFVDAATADAGMPGPIATLGSSLGGLYAAHIAARDPRVAACVVNGGNPVPAMASRFRSIQEQYSAACGSPDEDSLEDILRKLRFDPARHQIPCPVLSLHGGADPIVDLNDAQAFASASPLGQLVSWPNGKHTLHNHARKRDALVADWLAGKLRHAGGGRENRLPTRTW
jgi:alpha-beta hydrolase superfamily lysophospholipase